LIIFSLIPRYDYHFDYLQDNTRYFKGYYGYRNRPFKPPPIAIGLPTEGLSPNQFPGRPPVTIFENRFLKATYFTL
jgi:hypothetical protein